MAQTCGNISLFWVVTICSLLVVVAIEGNDLPADFGRRLSTCSNFLLPLLWSNVKNVNNAPWCANKKKFYDPVRELHKEINKAEDKGGMLIYPTTTQTKESEDFGSVGPFVANILSGHSGPLCPQCPLIPVIPECPYIPPCPVCPTPVCPSIPPFPAIPPCPTPIIRASPKLKMMSRNKIVKTNSSARPIAPPKNVTRSRSEGVIFITNTNGCTAGSNRFDVNLAPCTRGSGASRGMIDVTFTAPDTSVMIGIAAVSPTTPISLTCASFPSSFFGVTQSGAITPASPTVTAVGYVQFLASVGRDNANKSLKCFWSSS
ncbi:uncharacterized protein LOC124203551 [Daphnia pulex]|uniref:uncharacterized protein LOC124203551 n=1 Tax=Daphnia pulex TaxID=6669 RepID=UPI001EE0B01D|nr:uncharacterized protein LOC124203551 [Daphnia pulex]